jgi:MscS family membrane protein
MPNHFFAAQRSALLFLIGWFCWRLIFKWQEICIERCHKDVTNVEALGKLGHLVVFILFGLTILQSFGIGLSGLLAFGGMGGLVVGMAAKDLLGNFFGALMIYLDKPFKVGDWIRSPDRSIEGTVEKIGWRLTRIRTFEQRPLYIPNGVFTQIVVENASRMYHRRINETFGLRYKDIHKIHDIIKDTREMLRNNEDIATDQTLIVNFTLFNNSSLDFFIYAFTKTTDWIEFHEVKEKVLLEVAQIVINHEAEFAFPTRQLHIDSHSEASAVVDVK